MTPFQREVRARIYRLFADGERVVDIETVARDGAWQPEDVADSFAALAAAHRIALTEKGTRVWMAHPFSGVPTSHRAVIGDRWWYANCAWDSLAILALLGDGEAHGDRDLVWHVEGGRVSPNELIHLLVPARAFWDDIGFT